VAIDTIGDYYITPYLTKLNLSKDRIAADLVKGKEKVTVCFEGTESNSLAGVFGMRMIRSDVER